MLPYTAVDMLNKMKDEHGLQPPVDPSGPSRSGRPSSKRLERIQRAVSSLISTVLFL